MNRDPSLPGVRVDVWLWAVRVYKTRNQAAQACRKGAVSLQGNSIKPSRVLRAGEILEVKKRLLTETWEVVALLERRVGAASVAEYAADLTPAADREAAAARAREARAGPKRLSGLGRPTKKDRRDWLRLDQLSQGAEDESDGKA